jgi:hypothetical protein
VVHDLPAVPAQDGAQGDEVLRHQTAAREPTDCGSSRRTPRHCRKPSAQAIPSGCPRQRALVSEPGSRSPSRRSSSACSRPASGRACRRCRPIRCHLQAAW